MKRFFSTPLTLKFLQQFVGMGVKGVSVAIQTSSCQREYTRESLNWKLHRTSAVLQRIKIRHAAQANALGAISAPVSGAGSIRERLSLDLSRRKAHCRGRI